jgi:hypothetical protein
MTDYALAGWYPQVCGMLAERYARGTVATAARFLQTGRVGWLYTVQAGAGLTGRRACESW